MVVLLASMIMFVAFLMVRVMLGEFGFILGRMVSNEWAACGRLLPMVRIEALVCDRCGAPVSVLYGGVCIRCAESVEPPMSKWREVLHHLFGLSVK